MKIKTLSPFLVLLSTQIFFGCQKEETYYSGILKDKLIGHWVETAPRDTVSGLEVVFYEDDTILIEKHWNEDIPNEKFKYTTISSDSLKIHRGVELNTFHRVVFYSPDSIEITKFEDFDLIWGYTDVTLYKIE